MPAKNKITIEDLAVLTQRGFVEVRSEMREGFKTVDLRFDSIEEKVEKLEREVASLKADMGLGRADSKEIK